MTNQYSLIFHIFRWRYERERFVKRSSINGKFGKKSLSLNEILPFPLLSKKGLSLIFSRKFVQQFQVGMGIVYFLLLTVLIFNLFA